MTTRTKNWMVAVNGSELWFANGREARRIAREVGGNLWRLVDGTLELQN